MAHKPHEIRNPAIREWFKEALSHGQLNDSFAAISQGSEEHKAWLAYFGLLGWIPVTLSGIGETQSKTWTAPCLWPESFSFVPPDNKIRRKLPGLHVVV
jgi:hypothetical protein